MLIWVKQPIVQMIKTILVKDLNGGQFDISGVVYD